MILWQQTNTKLNRADLLSLSTIKFCDVQPTTYLLVNLSNIDLQLYQLYRICFSLSLSLWCSWHIHHPICCCVVLLSDTIWRYGCEEAVRFIKHNIFQQHHLCILLTSSSRLYRWVDCYVCAIHTANLLFTECLCPESTLSLTHQHVYIKKNNLWIWVGMFCNISAGIGDNQSD